MGKKRKLPAASQPRLDAYLVTGSRKENHCHNAKGRGEDDAAKSHRPAEAILIDDDSGDDDNENKYGSTAEDNGSNGRNSWVRQRFEGMDAEGEADAREQWGERRTTK